MKWTLRILLALVAVVGVGCCSIPPRVPVEVVKKAPDPPGVFIEVFRVKNIPEGEKVMVLDEEKIKLWDIGLRFYENTEYNAVIQIIRVGGTVVVEAFRMRDGRFPACVYDHHWSTDYQNRTMFVYPGTVVGADWKGDFAMLERSEAGEVTNAGKGFNTEYQAEHKIVGRVIAADRSRGFTWTISAAKSGVYVDYPPERDIYNQPD